MIQPIVVRPVAGAQDRFEIIAGERRWRASQIAGLHEVPIVPVDVNDSEALEIAIIENVQREDLNAMEEAQGYHALANEFKRSQEDIAKIVGKSRSHVANMMRLTKLPAEVQAYIASGKFSAGHARALIGVPDPAAAAKRIVEEGLNVRQAEALAHVEGVPVRKAAEGSAAARRKTPTRSRWKSASATRSASRSTSITAIPAASCTSAIATSISSTRSCGDWISEASAHVRPLPPPLCIHGDRQQRALRDDGGERACLRISSAAVASCSMIIISRAALKLRSAVSTFVFR